MQTAVCNFAPQQSKNPERRRASTYLWEILQGKRFSHVVELGAAHGLGHSQHSQTVSGSQLFLWSQCKAGQREKERQGDRQREEVRNKNEKKTKDRRRLIKTASGEGGEKQNTIQSSIKRPQTYKAAKTEKAAAGSTEP